MWCVDSDVYLLTTHLWKFETRTMRWLWQPEVQIPLRTGAAHWTIRGTMYVYGGRNQSDMWSYNPRTRTATLIGSYAPTEGAAYWVHEQSNRLYIWGGLSDPSLLLRAFDVTTNVWHNVAYTGGGPDPTPYFGSATTNGVNTVYVYSNDRLWALDLSTFVWTQSTVGITTPPGPSRMYQVMWASNMLYGGSSGSKVYSDTWRYDKNQWTLLSNNVGPLPRQRFSTCTNVNGSLVLFGGDQDLNDLWVYGPVTELTVFEKLEQGLKSAVLWSFASAVLSAFVLLCFTSIGVFACVRRCKSKRGGGLSSSVKLSAGNDNDFSQL